MRARPVAILALVSLPAAAAAEPSPPHTASVGVGAGWGIESAVSTTDRDCGYTERSAIAVHGALGGGRLRPTARLGYASLDLPGGECDHDYSHSTGTGFQVTAALGLEVRTAPGPIRLHGGAGIGLDVVHLALDYYANGEIDSPAFSRHDEDTIHGLRFELTGGLSVHWRRYWLGPEVGLGLVRLAGTKQDGYETGTGPTGSVWLMAGADL